MGVYKDRHVHFECCHHCEKRFIGCHATCKDYIITKSDYEKVCEHIRTEKQKERMIEFYVDQSKGRMIRRRGNGSARSK